MPVFAIWHLRNIPPQNKKVDSRGQFLTNQAENFMQVFHELEQF